MQKRHSDDYVIQVHDSPHAINAEDWDGLLASHPGATPFMQMAYLRALHDSGCASTATGWSPSFFTLHAEGQLHAACVIYLKSHSYGEYVFDWAWARAYEQHGLDYYPKAVVAVPFTPVPGTRLLARDVAARKALVRGLLQWCEDTKVSSLHLLFGHADDLEACEALGMMQRHTVQFHWNNREPAYQSFDDFLSCLSQDKRKKIRQERRKVQEAGVQFRHALGAAITEADWDFFYRCYERTYLEHGNAPYLSREFFRSMDRDMASSWLLFVAEVNGQPIACSLIALHEETASLGGNGKRVAYGRYWGALQRVDCLHFEACYYQPLLWCIEHGYHRFEGGAQGEHKMARALLPVDTPSAHWLAHPAFADAVARFLERESDGVRSYMDDLARHSPLKSA